MKNKIEIEHVLSSFKTFETDIKKVLVLGSEDDKKGLGLLKGRYSFNSRDNMGHAFLTALKYRGVTEESRRQFTSRFIHSLESVLSKGLSLPQRARREFSAKDKECLQALKKICAASLKNGIFQTLHAAGVNSDSSKHEIFEQCLDICDQILGVHLSILGGFEYSEKSASEE